MNTPVAGRVTEPVPRRPSGDVPPPSRAYPVASADNASLVDILDRLLAGGVTVCGDLELSIADVPLVRIDLRALIAPAYAAPGDRASRQSHPAGGVS
ncbi:gas vesicle protein [Streptodolium elevatio]|uniref:Gas vesicle protein n=1 Tax=Streptodolium elevatio TaxID=3157996 RepID=A0ABV3DVL5_9ACTN